MITRPPSRIRRWAGGFVAGLLLGLSSLAPGGRLVAQAPPQPLVLADALRLARARHPALVAASARRLGGAALARQEAAFANPTVEWRREDLGSQLVGDAFFTVTQPIDLTGRRRALRAGAVAVDRRGAADSVTVARALEMDVGRAFWRASLAQALLALASGQRADAERLASSEAARAREGAIAESWAMRVSLESERAWLTEATARAEWAHARADLARAVAVPPDSLPAVAALEPWCELPDSTSARRTRLEVLVTRARGARSELAAARAAQDVARHREQAARRGVLADLGVQAGTKRTAGRTMQLLGLALPLPLLSQGAAARTAASAERQVAEAEARTLDAAVTAEVTGAVDGYRALLAARPADGAALAARATEVARIAEGAYAVGGASLVELLDARRARAETLAALLRWTAELRLAALDVMRATGAPLTDALEIP